MRCTLNSELFIHGKNFSPAAVFVGYIFLAVGAVALFTNPLIALLPIGTGIFFCFSLSGTEVDLEGGRIREYVRVFWTRQGDWKELEHYPHMVVTRKTLSYTTTSYYSNQSVVNSDKVYDVCLLSVNHHKRITLCRYPTVERAKEAVQELSQRFDRQLTSFNPAGSSASRRRR